MTKRSSMLYRRSNTIIRMSYMIVRNWRLHSKREMKLPGKNESRYIMMDLKMYTGQSVLAISCLHLSGGSSRKLPTGSIILAEHG
jgi:hypothetical protein